MINNRSTPAVARPSTVMSLLLVCLTLTLASCSSIAEKMPWTMPWSDTPTVDDTPEVIDTPTATIPVKSAVEEPAVLQDESVALQEESGTLQDEAFGPQKNVEQALIKENYYEIRESNYSNLLAEYEEVEQSVLVFPNDSLQLGDANKQIIEQYVDSMDPTTDVLSVIGCSLGQTAISNGNSLLALGRANRVKEAFMFSGVDHADVMEEGCWAPESFDEEMPRRGVLLTLKRRKDS